jgi:hypothetical protein
MSTIPASPPVTDKLSVILMRNNKVIYDSDKTQPNFALDTQLLKFCSNCGGSTFPIIYVCKDCNKRYVTQIEATTGKRLILALDEKDMPP